LIPTETSGMADSNGGSLGRTWLVQEGITLGLDPECLVDLFEPNVFNDIRLCFALVLRLS
jgi:hypothetical protein